MINSKPWSSKFNPASRDALSPPPISAKVAAAKRTVSPVPLNRSARPTATLVESDMSRQVAAEWDAQMDGLDKQQEKLLNDQWHLLRTQIGSLMGALSEMRAELAIVKEAASKEHLESAIQELLSNVDAHGQAHASIAERVSYLEEFIGESADKHRSLNVEHETLKTTMETRLEYLEGLIGDSAEKHSKDLSSALGKMKDLHAAVASCAKSEHQSGIEKRVSYLEAYLGESSDNHDTLKTTLETRLEYIEKLLGDSAESHSREIKEAQKKLKDLHVAVGSCALADHHTNLGKRMAFLEKELGESADKHDKHKTSIEDRMDFLEVKVGDSAEKHWKEIEAAKAKLGDVHKAVSQCAKQEHHSSLEKRLAFLEKECGESFDKHDKHKTTMEDRMEFLEAKVGDSAEKHWKEIEGAKAKLGDIHKAVLQCAKQEHHSSLEKRLAFLEKECGESFDKHDKHKTTMEDRMEFLEAKVGDSAEKHWKEIQATKEKLGDIHKAVSQAAKQDHASSLDNRLGFLENMVGDNADKHAKDMQEHRNGFKEHKESMETRLAYLEALLGDSADKHWKEIDAAKKKLGSVELAVSKCAKAEHHSNLEQRVAYLEKDFGDSIDNHTKSKDSIEGRLESVERKLKDLGIGLDSKGQKSEIEKLEGIVLAGIDKRLTSVEEKHMQDFIKRLNEYEKKHMQEFEQMKGKFGDIDKALKECANIEHYLGLDRKHGALSLKQAEIADAVNSRMKDVGGKIEAQKVTLENVKILLEQRMGLLEGRLAEGYRSTEAMKDLEQRFIYFQEDQKRARDVLESALQEQIRLEHSAVHTQASQIKEQWDRELRARQAYQENYQELLGQERSAREVVETHISRRFEMFERSIYAELQRLWQEMQKETPPIIVQRPPPTYSVRDVVMPPVMSPRMQSVNVSPLPSYVSAASIATAPSTAVAYEAPLTSGTMTISTSPVLTRRPSSVSFPAAVVP